jgi:hypothetical protein
MSDPGMNNMVVGYSPGDFFYSSVENPPNKEKCHKLLSLSIPCASNFIDNSQNCIQLELCKNNDAVKQMYNQNASKWGTDELNYDTLTIYRTEYIFMWNLGIAIVGMLVAIYYLFSGSNITSTLNNVSSSVSQRFQQLSNSGNAAVATTAAAAAAGQSPKSRASEGAAKTASKK